MMRQVLTQRGKKKLKKIFSFLKRNRIIKLKSSPANSPEKLVYIFFIPKG
jgi:hypothetical protein